MKIKSAKPTRTPFTSLKGLLFAVVFSALPIQHASATYIIDIMGNGGAGIADLSAASALIGMGNINGFTASGENSIIEFDDLEDGTTGNFAVNNVWPTSLTNSFAAHITGKIYTGAGTFTYGLNHDDGAILRIDGNIIAFGDGVTDNRDSIGSITLAAGYHRVDILYFENFGGASLEFYEEFGGRRFLVAAVPEPGTLMLLGLGLAAFGFIRRKQA